MVALWGLMEDSPMAAVAAQLDATGTPWLFIDQRRTPELHFELEVGDSFSGVLLGPEAARDMQTMRGIYWRQYNFEQVLGFEPADRGSPDWQHALAFESALTMWCEHANARVINRPSGASSNNSKPFQLELIRAAGFAVPETLISSDPERIIEFWHRHGSIIYKSISSCRSIVAQFDEASLSRIDAVTCCPTQFQQYVAGVDYRAHVIDERIFASRIVCEEDDYRYSSSTIIEPAELPLSISERCIDLTRRLGLTFSGVDLRRTPDGTWFCFEVNPSPGFTYFEHEGRIATELVRWLSTDRE